MRLGEDVPEPVKESMDRYVGSNLGEGGSAGGSCGSLVMGLPFWSFS